MTKLKDKVKTALDETRMLVLGSQVLLGFQYRSAFEPAFEKLPPLSQNLKLVGLCLMLVVLGLLLAPGAYHRIVERGKDTNRLHAFTTRVMGLALFPFALALGIDMYVSFAIVSGNTYGLVAGIAASALALIFWYAIELARRANHKHETKEREGMQEEKENDAGTKLTDKIKHVLTESRVVLPGAQALLGFQFVTTLMEAFEKLPASSKYVHLASLFLVAASIILLMTPAAYHRIVEEGEETEHFHRFASRMLIAAMIPLALGVSGDLFVVTRKITESTSASIMASVALLVFFYGLWFGWTIYRRTQREDEPQTASPPREHQQAAS